MASLDAEDRQDEAAPLLPEHLSDLTERRMTGDEIRNKYRLNGKDDRFSKRKAAHKAANVTHGSYSPPPYVPSHSGEGLQATSQVNENRRKIIERGEKISALQQNSGILKSGAMGFQHEGAQLAIKYRKKKNKNIPTKQLSDQSTCDSTQKNEVMVDNQQEQQYKKYTFPEQHYNHHSSQSPTAPNSRSYNKKDEALASLYEEEGNQRTDYRCERCCKCSCSMM